MDPWLFFSHDVSKFFKEANSGGVHLTPGAEGVFAEIAGEAIGNFAFLPKGSVKEVVFLTCELIDHNSM